MVLLFLDFITLNSLNVCVFLLFCVLVDLLMCLIFGFGEFFFWGCFWVDLELADGRITRISFTNLNERHPKKNPQG